MPEPRRRQGRRLPRQGRQAGGVTIKTIVSQGEYATSVNEAQNIQAQLKEAASRSSWRCWSPARTSTAGSPATSTPPIALNGGRPDPDGMYGRYFTSTGNLNKVAGYRSARARQAVRRGQGHDRPGARKAIYAQVSDELENNAAWVWLFTGYIYTATSTSVKGFEPRTNAELQYLWKTTASSS